MIRRFQYPIHRVVLCNWPFGARPGHRCQRFSTLSIGSFSATRPAGSTALGGIRRFSTLSIGSFSATASMAPPVTPAVARFSTLSIGSFSATTVAVLAHHKRGGQFQYPIHRVVLCNWLLPAPLLGEYDVSVPYPSGRSLQHNPRCSIGSSTSHVSVPYPSGRSLQLARLWPGTFAPRARFQYPIHRVVLCNSITPLKPEIMVRLVSVPYPSGRSLQQLKAKQVRMGEERVSVPYPSGRSLQQIKPVLDAGGCRTVSVPYPSGRSLQQHRGGITCANSYPVSVPYPSGRSLQLLNASQSKGRTKGFQYPIHRVVLCNLSQPGPVLY